MRSKVERPRRYSIPTPLAGKQASAATRGRGRWTREPSGSMITGNPMRLSAGVPHEDRAHQRLPGRSAAGGGQLQLVRRQIDPRLRLDGCADRDRQRARGLWRSGAAGAGLSPGLRGGRARGPRRARPASDRPGSDRARRVQPAHGAAPQGPSLRQVRARHRVLGPARRRQRPLGFDAARRLRRREHRALSRDLPGYAGAHGRARRALPRPGLSAISAEGRRRPRPRHCPDSRGRERAAARRNHRGRRERQLARPSGDASPRGSRIATSISSSPASPTRNA